VTKGTRVGDIRDGASQTICIAESSDRANDSGLWISGFNCFSHDNGAIGQGAGEIGSFHSGGAYAAFADGSVRFLSSSLEPYVLGALCTRDLGEVVSEPY
jgi:prepilin-type processing-associated H-X9-DG protein